MSGTGAMGRPDRCTSTPSAPVCVEAPDEKVMARVSLELGSRGTSRYETLTAIPIDDFIGSL